MANNLLYPNISGAPGSSPITKDPAQAPDKPGEASTKESFNRVLDQQQLKEVAIQGTGTQPSRPLVNNQNIREPLKFSAHASARVQSRKLNVGPEQMRKLNEAVDKAAAKGLDDTLVLTKDAAFIISVKNKTVVTAMDRESLEGNVFTNIEGAVIV